LTGDILEADINTKLNEIHFKSPTVSTLTDNTQEYTSAGITVGSLLDFSNEYLLHSAAYSKDATELRQKISTSLDFSFHSSDQTLLCNVYPSIERTLGIAISSSTGLPNQLLPSSSDRLAGHIFGSYELGGAGAHIGMVLDTGSDSRLSVANELDIMNSLATTSVYINDFNYSNTLLIHGRSSVVEDTNIAVVADSHLLLYGGSGVHVKKLPSVDSEVANKKYVDSSISRIVIDNAVKKISLVGNPESEPITGTLFFDLSANTETSKSKVLQFKTDTYTDIHSSSPIRFLDSVGGNTSILQKVKFDTHVALPTDTALWSDADGVNKGFLKHYIEHYTMGTSIFLTKEGNEVISGNKLFNANPRFVPAVGSTFMSVTAPTAAATMQVNNANLVITSKVNTVETIASDISSTVTTKGYVDSVNLSAINQAKPVYGIWDMYSVEDSIIRFPTPGWISSKPDWDYYVECANGALTVKHYCIIEVEISGYAELTECIIQLQLLCNGSVYRSTKLGTYSSSAGLTYTTLPISMKCSIPCPSGTILSFSPAPYIVTACKTSSSTQPISGIHVHGSITIIKV